MILEEFDTSKEAIINPWEIIEKNPDMPRVAVTCYAKKTFDRVVGSLEAKEIAVLKNANGERPVYRATYKDTDIALFMADVGAPNAVGDLEEIYAMGVETIIMFGACGVLDRTIEDCSIIIPDVAIRDEGTSYHYAPPSDEIAVNLKYIPEFTKLLDEVECGYRIGKVWTTDAFFRETKTKMERRKEQGCICVDMECSALAAASQFRGKELFQYFYVTDNLDSGAWDNMSLGNSIKLDEKDRIAQLALELATRI